MTTDKDPSRAAFEAWAKSVDGDYQSCAKAGGHDLDRAYWSYSTEEQWRSWQASRDQMREDAIQELLSMYGSNATARFAIKACIETIKRVK